MSQYSELQIRQLRLSCPIYFSQKDYMKIKFIGLTVKFKLNTEQVNKTDHIKDTACFLTLKDLILAYSNALKDPVHIAEYGHQIIKYVQEITSQETPIKLEIEVFEKRSLVKSIFYIIEHNPGSCKAILLLKNVECMAKIGCIDLEKNQPQRLLLLLLLQFPESHDGAIDFDVSSLILDVRTFFEQSFCNTLEYLTNQLADYMEQKYCFVNIKVVLQKTSSISEVFSTGVELRRKTICSR